MLVKDGLGVHRNMAAVRPTIAHKFQARRLSVGDPASYPSAADTRVLAPYKVWDQGSIGSCTCQATPGLAVQILARSGIDWQPSRLWLYARVRQLESTPLTEDSGAEILDVAQILEEHGAPDETHWPYDLSLLSTDPPPETDQLAHHKTLLGFPLPNVDYMRASIGQGFGVSVGISAYESLMSGEAAQTGMVLYPVTGERLHGYHDIALVAYDDQKQIGTDTGAFCFLNSWSDGWGIGGYAWISYRYLRDYGQSSVTLRSEDPK